MNHCYLSARCAIRRLRFCVAAVAAALFLAGPISAAAPREELLRLVPDDAGFCLIVHGLRKQADSFIGSPFYDQFRTSSLGQELLQSPGARKLTELAQNLEAHLGLSWSRVRDDLLGDTVVFAYRPAPASDPSNEQGLILLRARDPKALVDLIARLNEVQQQSGEVKAVESRKYHEVEYFCRVEANRKHFYYLHGPLLALTAQEEMLRTVIDRERSSADRESPLVRQLRRLGAESALAVLYVNPRAFDAELAKKAKAAQGADALVLARIMQYWKALDAIALAATIKVSDVELAVTFIARAGELPEAARKFFAADPRPSDLWGRFPDDAMLATAGRLDATELTTVLGDFLPPEARFAARQAVNHELGAALGLDIVQDVLPNVGPDWGLCVSPPTLADRAALPAVLGALRVRPGDAAKPVDRALLDGLHSLAVLVVLGYNKGHADAIRLETSHQDQVEVQYLRNDKFFPAGWQPAFALKAGYLVLASSPEAIRRFRALPAGAPSVDGDFPLLKISIRQCRAYMKDRLDTIANRIAAEHGVPAAVAAKRLRGLSSVAEMFERLELIRRTDTGKATLVLRARTERPLAK